MPLRVGDHIVSALKAHNIPRIYCVPGESYLHVLDVLHEESEIQTITCRQEGGAGFMAVAEAKATGNVGVCAVSRGPGATNVSIAVHTAQQDAVPLLVLIGQVARHETHKHAFQEVDYSQFFGGMAKAVWELRSPNETSHIMARAFALAKNGIPGPVILVMPEDILGEPVEDTPALIPFASPTLAFSQNQCQQVLAKLQVAKRPLVIAGGQMRGKTKEAHLRRFAEHFQVPVVTVWKNQDVFDNHSPLYAGHLGFGGSAEHLKLLQSADLIIAAGTRLGDIATQHYILPRAPVPDQFLIHIYPVAEPLNTSISAHMAMLTKPADFLLALCEEEGSSHPSREKWVKEITDFMNGFMHFNPPRQTDGLDFGFVVNEVGLQANEDAVIVTDAGNFATWVHRYWRLGPDNLMLGGISGAMGFGIPSAVAASLIFPKRQVISVVGDGCLMMTGQELATGVQYGASPKIFLSDNSSYGTIRSHQERRFPMRHSGTNLQNPDFTKWVEAFGVKALRVTDESEVKDAVKKALAYDGPCLVHVKTSLCAISAYGEIKI